MMIEGSLEAKLPTIWTDEKQSREEAERRERLEERRVNQYKTCMDKWRSNRDDTAGFFEVAASEAETYAAEGAWSDVHDSNTKGLNLSTLVERLFSWQPVFSVGVFGR